MDDVGWSVLLICLFAGMSLFFSMSNLALRTFSRVRLQEAFKAAGKEDLVEDFVESVESLVLTCSLFAIIANVAIVALIVTLLSAKSYVLAFVLAVLIMAAFSLAAPHSWAKYTGEKLLCCTHKLLEFLARLAAPALVLLRLHDGFVRRLAGVTEASPDEAQDQKQEEILSLVEQGRMEGVVDEEEVEMIENVLELGDTTAQEIMTPRTDMISIDVGDDLKTILKTISSAGHSRIPVCEGNVDNIIGLIYAKDLLAEIGRDPQEFELKSKMRRAYFVPETKHLRKLLHEFQNQKLHIAIVLDEYGGTAGIVTIEDILEELVGEIVDEYETAPPASLKKIDDTTVEIDARMYIDDLNSEFELELPEDADYDTVGGFVFSHLGYIPKNGEKFDYNGLGFTIAAAEARKIKRIIIQKPGGGKESGT